MTDLTPEEIAQSLRWADGLAAPEHTSTDEVQAARVLLHLATQLAEAQGRLAVLERQHAKGPQSEEFP